MGESWVNRLGLEEGETRHSFKMASLVWEEGRAREPCGGSASPITNTLSLSGQLSITIALTTPGAAQTIHSSRSSAADQALL